MARLHARGSATQNGDVSAPLVASICALKKTARALNSPLASVEERQESYVDEASHKQAHWTKPPCPGCRMSGRRGALHLRVRTQEARARTLRPVGLLGPQHHPYEICASSPCLPRDTLWSRHC
eukprot:15468224-Alexandrium_andersonii.AAC.1